jgi:hypothetical protein
VAEPEAAPIAAPPVVEPPAPQPRVEEVEEAGEEVEEQAAEAPAAPAPEIPQAPPESPEEEVSAPEPPPAPSGAPILSDEGGMPTACPPSGGPPLRGHASGEGENMPSERRAGHATPDNGAVPESSGTPAPPADLPATLLREVLSELRRLDRARHPPSLSLLRLMAYILQAGAAACFVFGLVSAERTTFLLITCVLLLVALTLIVFERRP